MSFADKLSEFRKEKRMTIDELSELSGIPKGTLSKISAGLIEDPKLKTAKALLNALGRTLDDLDDRLPIKKPATPEGQPEMSESQSKRAELLLLVDAIPDDKIDKVSAILQAAIDAVK